MLYIVATPIGNLGDVSLRAMEVLRSVDVVASEDTRHTAKLLMRHEIKARQMPFHEHNESRVMGKIIRMLQDGRDVALVSDAGTPGIADPGFSLLRRCHDEGLEVTMVPGPAAFVMAVVLSGLAMHSFTYRGFPPRKSGKRRRFLEVDVQSPHTLVFYESPYRVLALIEDAIAVYGDRPAALCNDLTKKFEAVHRGTLSELAQKLRDKGPKGEYALVVAGRPEPPKKKKRSYAKSDEPEEPEELEEPEEAEEAEEPEFELAESGAESEEPDAPSEPAESEPESESESEPESE